MAAESGIFEWGNLRGSVRDSEGIVVESLMRTRCKSEVAGIRERSDLE